MCGGGGGGEGEADTFCFVFNFFKVYHLHIGITLPFSKLCYVFEEKLFFSVNIIL